MVVSSGDDTLVAGLRSGDDAVVAQLLNAWSRPMLALARTFVSTDASAEEVVQDTWLAVIRGIDGFEGRASLRTWVYRILVNTARKRGVREWRSVPWSSLAGAEEHGPSVDPELLPQTWSPSESAVLAAEVRRHLRAAIDALPERQALVLTLRDVLGHSSEEVCELLGITGANQRVLLHRGRAGVRARLAGYLELPAPVEPAAVA